MLMQLGIVTFEVYPFNAQGYSRDTGFDYVRKDVIGTMRPSESMGESDESMTIEGRLFPDKFGGLDSMDQMHIMRQSGTAQILVRGDGRNLGWFQIERISEKSSMLAADGVGKIIDFTITLGRSPAPSPSAAWQMLLRLFA